MLAPRAPERDAWIINQLVMAIFQYYSVADDDAAETIADDVWQLCLAAVGGISKEQPRPTRRRSESKGNARQR